ncbi:hypothetical protein K402DRAFT_123311 [Aulographum hederae CBS 113979]|uniref:BHLH domain-containing protein n=1 Tax=Aulographum hederae CBS 113979 TaxID=1176131 RepID=A0A6G1HE35_9PEZI|nr:hypothetical protein K402DRAFT_123311 [Aulographum hederae CBS 113979]
MAHAPHHKQNSPTDFDSLDDFTMLAHQPLLNNDDSLFLEEWFDKYPTGFGALEDPTHQTSQFASSRHEHLINEPPPNVHAVRSESVPQNSGAQQFQYGAGARAASQQQQQQDIMRSSSTHSFRHDQQFMQPNQPGMYSSASMDSVFPAASATAFHGLPSTSSDVLDAASVLMRNPQSNPYGLAASQGGASSSQNFLSFNTTSFAPSAMTTTSTSHAEPVAFGYIPLAHNEDSVSTNYSFTMPTTQQGVPANDMDDLVSPMSTTNQNDNFRTANATPTNSTSNISDAPTPGFLGLQPIPESSQPNSAMDQKFSTPNMYQQVFRWDMAEVASILSKNGFPPNMPASSQSEAMRQIQMAQGSDSSQVQAQLRKFEYGSDTHFQRGGFQPPSNHQTEKDIVARITHNVPIDIVTEAIGLAQQRAGGKRKSSASAHQRRVSSAQIKRQSGDADEDDDTEHQRKRPRTTDGSRQSGHARTSSNNSENPSDFGSDTLSNHNNHARLSSLDPSQPHRVRSSRRRNSAASKKPRENLTDEQKRQNHILSEQKRRTVIRQHFEVLCDRTPNLREGGFSKAGTLMEIERFVKREREVVEALEGLLGPVLLGKGMNVEDSLAEIQFPAAEGAGGGNG